MLSTHFAVVRCHEHRGTGTINALEQIHNATRSLRVEVARGLVAHQKRRTIHNGARNGNALLLATRKLIGTLVKLILQANQAAKPRGPES